MFEPAGRVCADPARRTRKEGSPKGRGGGARFLADFFAAQQRSQSPAGANSRPTVGDPRVTVLLKRTDDPRARMEAPRDRREALRGGMEGLRSRVETLRRRREAPRGRQEAPRNRREALFDHREGLRCYGVESHVIGLPVHRAARGLDRSRRPRSFGRACSFCNIAFIYSPRRCPSWAVPCLPCAPRAGVKPVVSVLREFP